MIRLNVVQRLSFLVETKLHHSVFSKVDNKYVYDIWNKQKQLHSDPNKIKIKHEQIKWIRYFGYEQRYTRYKNVFADYRSTSW